MFSARKIETKDIKKFSPAERNSQNIRLYKFDSCNFALFSYQGVYQNWKMGIRDFSRLLETLSRIYPALIGKILFLLISLICTMFWGNNVLQFLVRKLVQNKLRNISSKLIKSSTWVIAMKLSNWYTFILTSNFFSENIVGHQSFAYFQLVLNFSQ